MHYPSMPLGAAEEKPMFKVVGAAKSIPGVAGKEFESFEYFNDAMRRAYDLGKHFEVHAPDGKTFNPYTTAHP